MIKDDDVYLRQMLEAIETVLSYVNGIKFDDFERDQMLQDAVIRKIEIIGEAARRLSVGFVEDHADLPLVQAVSIRNKLIHEYDDIDLKIVWDTVTVDLQKIKQDIKKLV